jgi:hypothetical protein
VTRAPFEDTVIRWGIARSDMTDAQGSAARAVAQGLRTRRNTALSLGLLGLGTLAGPDTGQVMEGPGARTVDRRPDGRHRRCLQRG